MCRTRWITCSRYCVMLLIGLGCSDASKSDAGTGSGGHSGEADEPAGMDAGEPRAVEVGAGGDVGKDAGGTGGNGNGRGNAAGGAGATDGAAGSGSGGTRADRADAGLAESRMGGAAGSGGAGAADNGGASAADADDAAYAQCLNDSARAGQVVDDCTRCLCRADKCQADMNVATHDAKANKVVICSQEAKCTDLCCLCGDSACDLSNYATGPCAAEIESAAGATPGKGAFANGRTVNAMCAQDAAEDNSCRRVTLLAQCELDKCSDVCPIAKTCQ